jgi:hypothetical protein
MIERHKGIPRSASTYRGARRNAIRDRRKAELAVRRRERLGDMPEANEEWFKRARLR